MWPELQHEALYGNGTTLRKSEENQTLVLMLTYPGQPEDSCIFVFALAKLFETLRWQMLLQS